MVVEAPVRPVAPDSRPPGETLFAHNASKEDRVVVRLYALQRDDRRVRVAAEIYPVTVREAGAPEWFVHDFPTIEHARRYADEALLALEYVGCTVTEMDVSEAGPGTTAAERLLAAHMAAGEPGDSLRPG